MIFIKNEEGTKVPFLFFILRRITSKCEIYTLDVLKVLNFILLCVTIMSSNESEDAQMISKMIIEDGHENKIKFYDFLWNDQLRQIHIVYNNIAVDIDYFDIARYIFGEMHILNIDFQEYPHHITFKVDANELPLVLFRQLVKNYYDMVNDRNKELGF